MTEAGGHGTGVSVNLKRIRKHIEALSGIRHPNTGPKRLNAAADYIGQRLSEVGAVASEHFFTVDCFPGVFRNVEGVINAGATAQEWVICAHYDTVCNSPGVGDNASGVGVMLEAARLLAKHGPERTIRCIGFSLEEGSPVEEDSSSRLLGSRAWVKRAQQRGIDLAGVINLESVGYVGDSQCYPCGLVPECHPNHRFDRERGDFIAILSCEHSTALAQACFDQCCGPVDIPTVLVELPLKQIEDQFPDILRSDHASFWRCGFPAIVLTDTAEMRTPHYHQPSDTVETLNMEFAGKVCLATVLTVQNA